MSIFLLKLTSFALLTASVNVMLGEVTLDDSSGFTCRRTFFLSQFAIFAYQTAMFIVINLHATLLILYLNISIIFPNSNYDVSDVV